MAFVEGSTVKDLIAERPLKLYVSLAGLNQRRTCREALQ